MKKGLLVFLLASLVILGSYAQKPKYLFKIASEAPQGSLWYNVLVNINKELYKKTGKQVAMQIYAGGVMGDQATVIKKIKIGQLSGATFSNTGLQIIYRSFAIVGFPLVIRNPEEYDYFKNNLGHIFIDKLNQNGYELLAWSETGSIYLFSKKQVNSIGALKTAKPFVLEGDKTSLALFKEAKATPVHLQTSDILTSLQTGQIDTVFSPPYGLIAMQWHSKVNYMADFPITFMMGAVAVDKKLFDSMPASYQKIMKDLFKRHFNALTPKIRQDNVKAIENLKKFGIKMLSVSDSQRKVFYDVCYAVNNSLLKSEGYSQDIYNKVMKSMEKFRNSNQ